MEARRFIQIGTGGFGHYWCWEVLPRLIRAEKIEPAAAVDVVPGNLKHAMDGYGIPQERCFTNAQDAFRKVQADFAIIVVPPAHHEEMVDLAIGHGMDILSEKPIADTIEACARIYQKVTKAGTKMAVTMSHRFDQDKQTLERLIKSGKYGRLDYIVGRNTWTFRTYPSWGAFRYAIPDPLLIEAMVHHFDIMRALTGSDARTVYAKTWRTAWDDFKGDCQGLITVEMLNGNKVFYEGANANASQLNAWSEDYWRAECEKATLELDQRRIRSIMGGLGGDACVQEIPLEKQPTYQGRFYEATPWMNPWLAEMFVDWLNGGPEPPNSLRDNIQCAALLFAAVESAHTGQPVDVQAFLKRHLDISCSCL